MSGNTNANAPDARREPDRATAQLSEVSGQEFDYVVVGGGPAGLALAARLAEDASVSVAVLEAGGLTHQHDTIIRPAQYGREHGNPELVYGYETEFQPNLGRPMGWPRGRGIGGSTSINFMMFQKPHARDLDNWEELGSQGWNWARFHKALKRVETFHPPTEEEAERSGFVYDLASHGTSGPIHTSYSKIHAGSGAELKIKDAFKNLGVDATKDPAGGNIIGYGTFVNNIDPRTNTRSYAATGYFLDAPEQQNLKLLLNASARKVLFRTPSSVDGSSAELEAVGVEFEHDGKVHTVRAKREVILAAGTLRSSSLLELSGVGNEDILAPLGIQTLLHNPAVGENVQEHNILPMNWLFDPEKGSYETLDLMADPEVAAEHIKLYAEGKGLFLAHMNFLSWLPLSRITSKERMAELVAAEEERIARDLANPEVNRPGLREQWEIQLRDLKSDNSPDAEILPILFEFHSATGEKHPGKPSMSLCCAINRPFSRGSIHIKSADPNENARMDPKIFDHTFDLELFVEMFKFCRKVAATEPLKSVLLRETAPAADPPVATDEDIKNYIKANLFSTAHTAGTCAMRPLDAGGVVDPSLKVYGTKNLRVGDLSIIPLHVSSHTQTVAYAIGEQLADIIKAEACAT